MRALSLLVCSLLVLPPLAAFADSPPPWVKYYSDAQVESYIDPTSIREEEDGGIRVRAIDRFLKPHPAGKHITHTIRTTTVFCEYASMVDIRYEEHGAKGLIRAVDTPHGPGNEMVNVDSLGPDGIKEQTLLRKVCEDRQAKASTNTQLLEFTKPPVWHRYYADDLVTMYVDKDNARSSPKGLVFRTKSEPGPKNRFATKSEPNVTHYTQTYLMDCQQKQWTMLATDTYGPKGLVEHQEYRDGMFPVNTRSREEMTLFNTMCAPQTR